jgi:tRNA threonylcarbamoyladenosine biosynthesis protein TsaB
MIVVGFDTATDDTAVCAIRDGAPAYEVQIGPGEGGRPRHASALLPAVEEAASAAGGWDSVDRIAVGIGPGSFTGLRIGVSTARALAGSLSLPLAPVGTLDALGRAMAARAPDRHRLAVLDARRGEVFAALFDPSGARLWEPLVKPPAELAQRLGELPAAPLAAGIGRGGRRGARRLGSAPPCRRPRCLRDWRRR